LCKSSGPRRTIRGALPPSPATPSSSASAPATSSPSGRYGKRVPCGSGPLCGSGALWAAELPFAHADASVMCVFIAVVTVAGLGTRSLLPVVALTYLRCSSPCRRFVARQRRHERGQWHPYSHPFDRPGYVRFLPGHARQPRSGRCPFRAGAPGRENERSRIARDCTTFSATRSRPSR